jgi:hypothetical protein
MTTTTMNDDPFAGLDDVEPANQTVTETVVSHTANVTEVPVETADQFAERLVDSVAAAFAKVAANIDREPESGAIGAHQTAAGPHWIAGLPPIKRGGWFVYDLETVPDTTRFPKPEVRQPQDREPCGRASEELLKQPVNTIAQWLDKMSVAELQQMLAWETAGKNRTTLTDKIRAELLLLTGTDSSGVDQWRKRSFDPFSCRIVALGIATREYVWRAVAKTPEEERKLLKIFWQHVALGKQRIGYNITAFDDRVIVARSMLLKPETGDTVIDLGRYDKERLDLYTVLFGASRDSYKLKDLCEALNIVPEAGYEMRGDKVLDLVEADDWDGIAHYVQSDAKIERELYEKLADYTVV